MEYEGCYVYAPRSSKRRRIEPSGLHSSWDIRRPIYQSVWAEQETRLKNVLLDINESTISQIASYVQDTAPGTDAEASVPAALVLTGPSIASHALFFDQLSDRITNSGSSVFVHLPSASAPNLKGTLKHLIRCAIASNVGENDEEDDMRDQPKTNRKRPGLLNYDLQLLQNHVRDKAITRVIVAFQDCEAFDGALLSDIVELLFCWQDRIPFVFLFGVATSLDTFQAKLSKKAARCISGKRFNVVKADSALEELFGVVHSEDPPVWLGAGLCNALLRRQKDHIQSLDAFVDGVHYAYLSHFYANALSVFLYDKASTSAIFVDHFQAVRNLPSFQMHVQDLIAESKTQEVRGLLDSDSHLLEYLREQITAGRQALRDIVTAVDILHVLHECIPSMPDMVRSSLLIDALGGQLHNSATEKDILLYVRRCNSEALQEILSRLADKAEGGFCDSCRRLCVELDQLVRQEQQSNGPLRSEEDVNNSTLRTTVVAKKVELSKQKSALTRGDAAYSSLLRRFSYALEQYLGEVLISPEELPLHEIFLYDLKSPHRDVFTPKPRFAIERALAAPHDYLDCSCCAQGGDPDGENSLTPTQPPTALLYQLYLESGALINIADLYSAFAAIVADAGGESNEAQTSALFQRSLAELRYMGLVRATRKKADHVLKVSWRGL